MTSAEVRADVWAVLIPGDTVFVANTTLKPWRLEMKRSMTLIAFAVVGVLAFTSLASGKSAQTSANVMTFRAALNTGQVVPHLKNANPRASGHFTATLTGTTLKWTLTFSHLSGPAMAAHIHMGARGKNGMALVALCGPCKSPISGTANSVPDDVVALMNSGAYVNVHTAKNAEGEIRGEVTVAR